MGLGPYWYQIMNKISYKLKVRKVYREKRYMSTGSKVPSLECKCIFHGPEHEMQK